MNELTSEYPCPCGSGSNFDACHGVSKLTEERLYAAIHEVGHASSLPANSGQHVSFLEPCPLCRDGAEASLYSLAHTSYSKATQFDPYGLLLYGLAGGASEIVCGGVPASEKFEFGEFPASMGNDFEDLRVDFEHRGIWEEAKTSIGPCFVLVVEHFKTYAPAIRGLALQLIDKQILTHEEVNFEFIDRDQLLVKMQEGEPAE